VAQARDDAARSLHERVFAWMTLADERNLEATFVAGQALNPGAMEKTP
jgi:guanine deaminase